MFDTGHWQIWIDDLDGELAMKRTITAVREVSVVEQETFDRVLSALGQAEEDIENLKMICRRLAFAKTLESRNNVAKQCHELFKGSILRDSKGASNV